MPWFPSWSRSLLGGRALGRLFGPLLGQDGLGPGDVAARHAQRAGVVQLLRGLLHAQAEVSLLQLLDLVLQRGNVFLAQFSGFHLSGTPGSRADHAADEGGAQRQLGSGQAECLAREFFGHPDDLEHHLARLDFGHVILGIALAVAHPHFGGLVRARLVGEHPDPDAAAALDVAGNRAARSFDLAGRQAAAVRALQAEVTECHRIAPGGDAGVAALLLLAVFAASGLQHVYSPLPSAEGVAGAALRTRLTVVFGASAPGVASAGLSLPSAGATLPAPAAVRRGGGPRRSP